MAHEKKMWNTEKDGPKGTPAEWTEKLLFDEDGAIYVKDEALAEQIQSVIHTWGGHLTMYRDKTEEEKAAEKVAEKSKGRGEDQRVLRSTAAPTAGATSVTPNSGNLVNMMCPCTGP